MYIEESKVDLLRTLIILIFVVFFILLGNVIAYGATTTPEYPVCYKNAEFIAKVSIHQAKGILLIEELKQYDESLHFIIKFVYSPLGEQYTPIVHYNSYLQVCIAAEGNVEQVEKYMKSLLE